MMGRRVGIWALGLACAAMAMGVSARAGDDLAAVFETTIRPILIDSCVECHGPDKQKGGLRLDTKEATFKGGHSGPAIVPGDLDESILILAVSREDDDFKMPPVKPLTPAEQKALTDWVAAGAVWPDAMTATADDEDEEPHWAFQPLNRQEPPSDPSGWAKGAIDAWIAAGHREHGVAPVEQADRRTLIRRATFDLIGLPPDPDRVEAFAADERPDAFARLIDELLASPQYGERWGRYWLDLARYADTAGDNSDYPIPEAYLYRDYVIDAFNADLPYDRFLHEQLAGDIMAAQGPPEDRDRQIIATGFVAQAKRFGTRKLEDIHQIIEDALNTTGQTVLGMTLRCARCHDHKFDPITEKEYYSLYGIFAGTKYPFAGAEEVRYPSEFAPLAPPEVVADRDAQHAEAVAKVKAELDAAIEAKRPDEDIKKLRDALANKQKESPYDGLPLAYALREGPPVDAKIQKGGDPRKLGEVAPRGVPQCLDENGTLDIPEGHSGRLEFARWLTEGPVRALTARVMANRIWQHHFGKPIVATPSDFGFRGIPPTHPELLEELAAAFIDEGWSVKAMHRRVMMSKTYQLAAAHNQAAFDADSGNDWYWRADRRQLDAEALRDSILALGGSLDPSRPGPHPFPPVEKWTYTAHHQFKALYPSNHRSVYLMVQRLHPHPYLSLFNGPDASMTTATRDSSSVPLQALFLMNDPFVYEQAEGFARSILSGADDDPARLNLAYARALSRHPDDAERRRGLEFLAQYREAMATEGASADDGSLAAWSALARSILASNEFHYVD